MKVTRRYGRFRGIAVLLALCSSGYTEMIGVDLSFTAPEQSMWGSGPSGALRANGLIGNTTIGFAYDIGASSGTVEGNVNGKLGIEYASSLSGAGVTPVTLNFAGNSGEGLVSSLFGAWVDFKAYVPLAGEIDLYQKGFQLEIDQPFTPKLGTTVVGSDAFTVKGIGVDAWIAGASVDFDIAQNDNLTPKALNGTLVYNLQGTDLVRTVDFSLTDDLSEVLSVNLDREGIWDFSFLPFDLDGDFNVDFDLELMARAYYKTLELPEWYEFWNAHWETHSTEYALLDIDVFDADPFALKWNPDLARNNVFSISVGSASVPEPSLLSLLGVGLVGLAGFRRIRTGKK